jgi:putative glycosyltransferase (TIGR04372 family)
MVRRNLPNLKGKWLSFIAFWNKKIPGGDAHDLNSSLTRSRDLEGLFQKNDVAFTFTKCEDNAAKNWLRSKGWQEDEPFVTLLVRDSMYLQTVYPDQLWGYHDYRNSNVQDYIPAIDWLTENRVWVLRMGRHTKDKLEINKNRFVDYSFDTNQSDLLDVWLFANATAVISTATGLDCLAGLYRRPILFLNALPLIDMASYFNMTWVPKNLIWQKSKEPLNLSQSVKHTYYSQSEYINNGIEIVSLTPEEIKESVKEFWEDLRGGSYLSFSTIERQKQFWKILKTLPNYQKYHHFIHPKAKVGSFWLSAQGDKFLQ